MKEAITTILINELGYSPYAARVTGRDLTDAALQNEDIADAVCAWMADRDDARNISEQEFSTADLVHSGAMSYPAALIFIDWLRADPEKARSSLCRM